MRKQTLPLALAAGTVMAAGLWLSAQTARSLPVLVGEPGRQTRMLVTGDRQPVVVFDSFGAASLEHWGTIQWRCSEFCRFVSYDHRGTGGSDPGPKPRDARSIATELHAALQAARLESPYLLVGYSFGGPYLRVFADLFPEEVCGLLLIDPAQEEFSDWLKVHRPDLNRIPREMEIEQTEYGCSWMTLNQARATKVPNIPVLLITAMRPFHERDHRLRPKWIECHQRWLHRVPGAGHIVTDRSDHGIIWEEPGLVVETIRGIVDRVRPPGFP